MKNSTRIVANTTAAYARLIVVSCAALFTIPIAIHVLGASDYGIFSVIAGSLTFLLFINEALISGAQRHIAYAMGQGDNEGAMCWLDASIAVHLVLAVLIASVAICFGNLIVYHFLNIPPARLHTAMWIYRMVVVAIGCNILCAPFQGLLLAYESIVPLSVINMCSAVTLLAGTVTLWKLPGDKLLWYGGIYVLSQTTLYLGPIIYCIVRYSECRRFKLGAGGRRVKELLSFSGWNLFGAFASVARAQGPAILLNKFLGPVANASYGLALQVNTFALNIGSGISRATSSPIIKRQGANDKAGMEDLAGLTSTMSFGMLWIGMAPFIFESRYFLGRWVHHMPPGTSGFVVLLLMTTMMEELGTGLRIAVQAVGKIARYQIVVGIANALVIPFMFVALRLGFSAVAALSTCLLSTALAGILRAWFTKSLAKISMRRWIRRVIMPAFLCAAAGGLIYLPLNIWMSTGLLRCAVFALLNASAGASIVWGVGLTERNRATIKGICIQALKRLMPGQCDTAQV